MSVKSFFHHRLPLLTACLLLATGLLAQEEPKARYGIVSVFNAATQLPIGEFFSSPVHLGATAGAEFRYNRNPKNQWFQTAKFGFSYHQYVQRTLQLYSEFGYRRTIWRGTAAELRLGAGYLHAIPAAELFTLDGTAYKKKSNLGRAQAMAGGAFGLSYSLPTPRPALRFFVDYQFYLQMPFVKSYVPLLPNTLLHLGAAAPFSIFKK